MDAIELFVPKTKTVTHNNSQPVWFNNDIRYLIKCLRRLRRKPKSQFNLDKLQHLHDVEDRLQKSLQLELALKRNR